MLATIGRTLVQHWPALVALHLAGVLVRYGVIELAGWVGAASPTGGLLIMPIAVIARVAAFVGMFLVVRDSLRQLSAIAPAPETPEGRRTAFLGGLLGGILPFFAVYAATGSLQEDWTAYSERALEVQSGRSLESIFTGEEVASQGTVFDVELGPIPIALIVIALVGRWAWGRWESRLPRPVALVAVYLEGVWLFLTLTIIGDLLATARAWIDERQAVVWVADARDWLGEALTPVAWLWDALDWLLGQAGAVLGEPLAWLTIAGVMYGQAVAAQAPELPQQLAAARSRFAALPAWMQTQARQLGSAAGSRVLPIWRAFVLMLRAGPVLIGATALLYAVVEALGGVLQLAITRIVGPQGLGEFWMLWDAVLMLPVALVVECLRVAVIAGAYDSMIGRLRGREAAAADEQDATTTTDAVAREAITGQASGGVEEQPGQLVAAVEHGELGHEGSGVGGHDVGQAEGDRSRHLEA